MLVAAPNVLHHGGVVTPLEIAVQVPGVGGQLVAVQLAADEIQRQKLGVLPVVGAILARFGDDGNHAGPQVRVG